MRLHVTDPNLGHLLAQGDAAVLRELFIVSQAEHVDRELPADLGSDADRIVLRETAMPGLAIEVRHAPGRKCARCWKWDPKVGVDPAHPELCPRCAAVLRVAPAA